MFRRMMGVKKKFYKKRIEVEKFERREKEEFG